MNKPVINFVLFQIGWFACVLGGAYNYPATGSFIALGIIAYHLLFTKERYAELILIITAMILGYAWDSYLVYQQWVSYSYGQFSPNTAPYWIVVMWGLFSTTLNNSLKWLKNRLALSVLFGAIGGPLAYYAGNRLGALEFVEPQNVLIALAIGWAIITPLLFHFTDLLDGFRTPQRRSMS